MAITQDQLETFKNKVQAFVGEHMKKNFPILDVPEFSIEAGKKYARIVKADPHRSVWAFVAIEDSYSKKMGSVEAGQVFKADSWNAPAKHARGTIDQDLSEFCGPYGPNYR